MLSLLNTCIHIGKPGFKQTWSFVPMPVTDGLCALSLYTNLNVCFVAYRT